MGSPIGGEEVGERTGEGIGEWGRKGEKRGETSNWTGAQPPNPPTPSFQVERE
jgi:hypothetical protein